MKIQILQEKVGIYAILLQNSQEIVEDIAK